MMFVGHKKTLDSLPTPLPPVLLLSGPEGVGKRTLAYGLARSTGAKGIDLQMIGALNKEKADQMRVFHSQRPLTSPVKTTVADLTWASPESLNAVLKILEEPPAESRFILHTDREVPLTVKSRAFQLRFGTLSTAEVAEVLRLKKANDPETAARVSGGRVSVALDYAGNAEARERVEGLLTALKSLNARKLEYALFTALKVPDAEHRGILEVVVRLLRISLFASMSDPGHILAFVPEEARREAAAVLVTKARPAMKIRGAMWMMAGAV